MIDDPRLEPDALDAPARAPVPSEREHQLGQAGTWAGFEPTEVEPPPLRRSIGERLGEAKEGLDPRRIAGDHSATPLILLSATAMFTSWDDAALGVLLPEIRDDFGFDLAFLGVIGVVFAVLRLLLAPAAGWLADRVKRTRMVQIGAISGNLSSVTFALSPTISWLMGTRVVAGVAGTLTEPASLPLLTDYYPQGRRARVFAFQGITANAGRIIGPLVAGLVGALAGWRPTVIILGMFATLVSLLLFKLPEPVRGALDRRALGADDDTVNEEQPAVSWAEGWRAASSIGTLRRIWYATPFLTAAGEGFGVFLGFYWADVFGVGPFGRGMIISASAALGMVGLMYSGPISDRLLAHRPERIMTLFAGLLTLGCVVILGLAVSPVLWLSVVISLPLAVVGAMILPALGALVSLVVPARMRAFGLQTTAPWRMLGIVFMPFVLSLGDSLGLRQAMVVLIPVYLVGAAILASSSSSIQRDIRTATAAALADEQARRTREHSDRSLLICRGLEVFYDSTQVLFGVDLEVGDGEILALLGTNGAGKSTLLRAIAGVHPPAGGAIFLDGRDVTHRPSYQGAADGVVLLPGGRAVFPSLTVAENLRAAGWTRRKHEGAISARMADVLELFPELADRMDQEAGTMSGGEQQMLAVGQALLMEPRLLMIDELSLGLAPKVVERLLDAVRQINATGTTVILVEQSVNVAVSIAERAVFMEKGRIHFDGPTRDLLGRGDLVRSVFLGGAVGGTRRLSAPSHARTGDAEPVLRVEELSVRFGGVVALDGVDLEVSPGEVVGIIGPNGAGKTTLFDAISGYVPPERGQVWVGGVPCDGLSPDARARLGLGRSFQAARLFPSLTVREAIEVALDRHLSSRSAAMAAAWTPQSRRSERRARRRVDWLIELLSLGDYADKFVSELSTGSRRMVDLAGVLASEPRVLLLDEPSTGLAQAETELLGPVMRRIAGDAGCGVAIIEHDIPLVTEVSHHMVALDLGRRIAAGTPDDVVAAPEVVAAYLGASDAVIHRSGHLADALAAAGLDPGPASHRAPAPATEPVPDEEST